MGTRSDIIVHKADGKWARIYCHFDGYIEHNGKILFESYSSQAKADALVALGDLSALGSEIGEKHEWRNPFSPSQEEKEYQAWEAKFGDTCSAYGRDRGESGTAATTGDTLESVWPDKESWTEFTYVFVKGEGDTEPRWYVADPDGGPDSLKDLGDVLLGKETIRPFIKSPFGILGRHSGVVDLSPKEAFEAAIFAVIIGRPAN